MVLRREFHMTPQREIAPLVVGLAVATGAIAAQYGLRVRCRRFRTRLCLSGARLAGVRRVAGAARQAAPGGQDVGLPPILRWGI